MNILEFHPAANLFPLMEGAELRELVDSIAHDGYDQTQPIHLFEGRILDGRNRWRACQELNIDCPAVEWSGDDPWHAVIRWNQTRRHLSVEQRIAIAAEAAPRLMEEARHRQAQMAGAPRGTKATDHRDPGDQSPTPTPTRHKLSDGFGISKHAADQAMALADKPKDDEDRLDLKQALRDQMKSGDLTAAAAVNELSGLDEPPIPEPEKEEEIITKRQRAKPAQDAAMRLITESEEGLTASQLSKLLGKPTYSTVQIVAALKDAGRIGVGSLRPGNRGRSIEVLVPIERVPLEWNCPVCRGTGRLKRPAPGATPRTLRTGSQ